MTSSVYETIKAARKLPSPTGVTLQILKLAQDGESTVEETAGVAESAPASSSRLLKKVNSPLAGMPRQSAAAATLQRRQVDRVSRIVVEDYGARG